MAHDGDRSCADVYAMLGFHDVRKAGGSPVVGLHAVCEAGGSIHLRSQAIVGDHHEEAVACEPVDLRLRDDFGTAYNQAAAVTDQDSFGVSWVIRYVSGELLADGLRFGR